MARVRLTVSARNTDGLRAKVRARTERKKQRLLTASVRESEATFDLAQALCPRDTNWMADHMRLEYTRGGYNWLILFRRGDFVGKLNTNADPPRTITEFYPLFVVEGTSRQSGNDFLHSALALRRAQILESYRRAVAG